jgi:hypothetical protein
LLRSFFVIQFSGFFTRQNAAYFFQMVNTTYLVSAKLMLDIASTLHHFGFSLSNFELICLDVSRLLSIPDIKFDSLALTTSSYWIKWLPELAVVVAATLPTLRAGRVSSSKILPAALWTILFGVPMGPFFVLPVTGLV